MFTGIVTDVGSVIGVSRRNDVQHLAIACHHYAPASLEIGASIACAGICLTIIARDGAEGSETVFEVEAGPETLELTTASAWDIGTRVNLERPVKLGDELSGHLVRGHVEGLAPIVAREDLGETTRFRFEAPGSLARLIAPKGSITLDGTSLTVNSVEGSRFDCVLIPHTLQVTTWNERRLGDRVNLEVDMIARYVARLAEFGKPG